LTQTLSGVGVHVVELTWTASSSPGVTGYNVYRSNSSTGPFNAINSSPVVDNSFVDSGVTAGETYYYATTAIGPDAVESAYSNMASASVPTP
jgi:fibronectin type 3 domain-containing protein